MDFSTNSRIYKPDGVFIATEDDGSQWVMLENFVTAQQSVQLTAFGVDTQASFPLLGGSQAEESSATLGGG